MPFETVRADTLKRNDKIYFANGVCAVVDVEKDISGETIHLRLDHEDGITFHEFIEPMYRFQKIIHKEDDERNS